MSGEPPFEDYAPIDHGPPPSPCWRCGKLVDAGLLKCPFCAASAARDIPPAESGPAASAVDRTLMHMLAAYAALLAFSVVTALIVRSALNGPRPPSSQDLLTATAVLEVLDTVVVVIAIALIPLRVLAPAKSLSEKAAAWFVFMPVLAMLLIVNLVYHWIIRSITHIEMVESDFLKDPALIRGWIVAVCIQPAIVEELFFRYLALGALRPVVGVHAAVVLSAVMFGMLHLGVPVSIPMLIVLGIGLGYARVYSGGMVLPMVLHCLHNAAVLALERMMSGQ